MIEMTVLCARMAILRKRVWKHVSLSCLKINTVDIHKHVAREFELVDTNMIDLC